MILLDSEEPWVAYLVFSKPQGDNQCLLVCSRLSLDNSKEYYLSRGDSIPGSHNSNVCHKPEIFELHRKSLNKKN